MADSISNTQQNTKLKDRYLDRKDKGVCVSCGVRPASGGVECESCRDLKRSQWLARKLKKVESGLCVKCHEPHTRNTEMCELCMENNNRICKLRRDSARKEALDAYGHKCACCGLTNDVFPAFDHVNDDGHIHRKSVPPHKLFKWLKLNQWPKSMQLLCHNCNWAKYATGDNCPHKLIDQSTTLY